MTDLHAHILPGMDDGARDTETALALLQLEQASGVTQIALTPHFYPARETAESFLQRRQTAWQALQTALPAALSSLALKLAAEVRLAPDLLATDPAPLCIEGTHTMMVELPSSLCPPWAEDVLYQLRLRGIDPVLVHVERYPYLLQDLPTLAGWIQQGIAVQVNAASLLPAHPSRTLLLRLIRRGWVHLIATDTHSLQRRPPLAREAFVQIRRHAGAQTAQTLLQNADAVFAGQALTLPEPKVGLWQRLRP